MYEIRSRSLLRGVLSPFTDGAVASVCGGACVLLLVGGWVSAGGAAVLFLFVLRGYATKLRADARGLVVTNRFLRHRIPWGDVRAIWAPPPSISEFVPTVEIVRTGRPWRSVSIYATLGMRREQRRVVALDLVELARSNGYRITGGSEEEVTAQLESERNEPAGR